MGENTIKKETTKSSNSGGGRSVFAQIERVFNLEEYFREGIPLKIVPHILFTTGIILFYIANSYYAEKMVRETQTLKKEIEDLRADYTTMKAQYMYVSKQSEVAKGVEKLGLVESKKPPYKVKINKKEL